MTIKLDLKLMLICTSNFFRQEKINEIFSKLLKLEKIVIFHSSEWKDIKIKYLWNNFGFWIIVNFFLFKNIYLAILVLDNPKINCSFW